MLRTTCYSILALLLYWYGYHLISVYQYELESSLSFAGISLISLASLVLAYKVFKLHDADEAVPVHGSLFEKFHHFFHGTRHMRILLSENQFSWLLVIILTIAAIDLAYKKTDEYYESLPLEGIPAKGLVVEATQICDEYCGRAIIVEYHTGDSMLTQLFPDPQELFSVGEQVNVLHHSRYPHISEVYR